MNEPKTQMRIITALLIVVIALAGGLFFYLPKVSTQASGNLPPVTGEEDPAPPPAVHVREREAEISLDPSLVFTQTIGGSGDESIVDVYYDNNKMYIFGNTTSSDLDFDSAGAFLAILEGNGKIVDILSYEGEAVAVTLYNGGFVMVLDRDGKPVVLAVNYSGNEINSIALPVVRNETALDLKYVDDGYLVVTALVESNTGFTRLKLSKLSSSLEFVNSVVTEEVYSLEYIDTLDVMGDYRLVANAVSDIKNMVCIGTWGKKLAHYPLEFTYSVKDFWITDDFWYLAVADDRTLLIKQSGETLELCPGKANHCAVMGDEKYMYISADSTFFCVSGGKILFSAEYGPTSFFADKYTYAVSSTKGTVTVRSFIGGSKAFESDFKYELENARVFTCESGLFVLGNTSGKYGASDITLIRVDY